jgi:cell division protein ZapA (FtsZ GTPase activity inhibitor)
MLPNNLGNMNSLNTVNKLSILEANIKKQRQQMETIKRKNPKMFQRTQAWPLPATRTTNQVSTFKNKS